MLGTSFDVFHKNPKHQRSMLADASRLPHRTKIKLGPEVLELQVSAIASGRQLYRPDDLVDRHRAGADGLGVSQVVEIVNAAAQECGTRPRG